VRNSLTVVGLGLLLASAASAEEHQSGSFDLSLRVGVVGESGDVLISSPLFPVWLGVGYRFGGVWYVGVAGLFALGPSTTTGGVTTNPYNAQFLVEMAIHPAGYSRVDPWVGFGLGAEWYNGVKANFVPVSFDLGVDFALGPVFRLGPFAAVQVAFNGNDTHEWFVVGLKLSLLP
jgi:hypothetical protein